MIQNSRKEEDLISYKLFEKSGIQSYEEVTSKLPKLKRAIPGVEY